MGFNPFKKIGLKKKNKDMIIDLTENQQTIKTNASAMNSSIPSAETSESGLGFLGNLAEASSNNLTAEEGISNNQITQNQTIDPEKFERFGRRIDKMLQRIELIERKLERVEHRLDIS